MAEITAELKLTGWNASQLLLRVPIIMAKYGDVMDRQLKEEIKTVQYYWPNKTERRNGITVSSPRDIVDLGNFFRSQRRDFDNATTIRFTWNVKNKQGEPYAAKILEGYSYITKSGRAIEKPGRNWIKPALEKHPLDHFFIREWRRLSRSGGL